MKSHHRHFDVILKTLWLAVWIFMGYSAVVRKPVGAVLESVGFLGDDGWKMIPEWQCCADCREGH